MEPLVSGGQGRSDDDTEHDGKICGWCFLAMLIVALVLALPFVLSGCDSLGRYRGMTL